MTVGIDFGDRHDFHAGIGQKTLIGFMQGGQFVTAFFVRQSCFLREKQHDVPCDAI